MVRKFPGQVVLCTTGFIRATGVIAVCLLNNCLLNGVCACMFVVYYGEKERVKRIFIRPNYESHATHFVLLTHWT